MLMVCVHEPLFFLILDANEAVDFLEKMMEKVRTWSYMVTVKSYCIG